MQTWVKITKRKKGKHTLIDCKRLSIDPIFFTFNSISIDARKNGERNP